MRQAFNDAEAGKEVKIERFDKTFILVEMSLFNKGIVDAAVEGRTAPPIPTTDLYPKEVSSNVRPDIIKNKSVADATPDKKDFCKAGHWTGGASKCLQKGCKYA